MIIQIHNLELLAGKTIERAVKLSSWNDSVGIIFKDQTFIILTPTSDYDCLTITTHNPAESSDLRDMGLISQEEYRDRIEKQAAVEREAAEKKEQAEWQRLNRKYGGCHHDR